MGGLAARINAIKLVHFPIILLQSQVQQSFIFVHFTAKDFFRLQAGYARAFVLIFLIFRPVFSLQS
jgi:hypothetical protein